MVTNINSSITSFQADNRKKDKGTGKYQDPLMHWPLRGMAFTNELGEAMRPLIGHYATLSWVPALMYMGADIYDKYKNNKTQHSPDSVRCLKQAIFQAMASIFLPLVVIHAGQDAFSLLGRLSKDKLSINVKEQVSNIAEEFIANGQMRAFDGRDNECIKEFIFRATNNIDFKEKEKATRNPFNKLLLKIENAISKLTNFNSKENIESYCKKSIKTLIELRKMLLDPSENFKKTIHYENFKKAQEKGQTENVAIKSALSKFQKNCLNRAKLIKIAGGLVALAVTAKPIDIFVENVIIGSIVTPGIDKFNNLKKVDFKSLLEQNFH